MTTFAAIPTELTERNQWVGHRQKVPHAAAPSTTVYAATDNPATWAPYAVARLALDAGYLDGLGFVFTVDDPYVFVDLDHCRDPQTGTIDDWALAVVRRLNSYTEISPSGTGLRIFLRAVLPSSGRRCTSRPGRACDRRAVACPAR